MGGGFSLERGGAPTGVGMVVRPPISFQIAFQKANYFTEGRSQCHPSSTCAVTLGMGVAGCNVEPALLLVCSPRCPHSGTARYRAWRQLGPPPEPCTSSNLQPPSIGTPAALSHGGGNEKDSPMEACTSAGLCLQGWKTDKGLIMKGSRWLHVLLLIPMVPLGGCMSRSRPVVLRTSTAQLETASSTDLVERINAEATKIQTLKATVALTVTVGGSKRGKITEYQEIRGYILARKPSSLRIIGLFPILQNHVFDMVSSGKEFKLWIPPKNQFIVGHNDGATPSTLLLGNLRPQVIYDALLLQAVAIHDLAVVEEGEHKVIEPGTQKLVLQPDYTLDVIKQNGQGWYLSRKIVFDRTDLQPHQQLLYDEHGSIVTDALYNEYREFNGVLFPVNIQIRRPQEEYSIKLEVAKLTINGPITDEQFVLEPPSGASLALR